MTKPENATELQKAYEAGKRDGLAECWDYMARGFMSGFRDAIEVVDSELRIGEEHIMEKLVHWEQFYQDEMSDD